MNLLKEGIEDHKIFFVGNVMIDTLLKFIPLAQRSAILKRLKLIEHTYAVLTMHRPTNVDEQKHLKEILKGLRKISKSVPIVFPIHPRTARMFKQHRTNTEFLRIIPPLGYVDFLRLMLGASLVLTDSGGIQEETTVLNIPCLTLRDNTERPVTVSQGTNTVIGVNAAAMVREAKKILRGRRKTGSIPKFWDGKAAQRISKIIHNFLRTHC
jgi:UDP-N-acetylglucosamine 2-epimerase (non-hydrolysing)